MIHKVVKPLTRPLTPSELALSEPSAYLLVFVDAFDILVEVFTL